MGTPLVSEYQELKVAASKDLAGGVVTSRICDLALRARLLLRKARVVPFTSSVEHKRYFGYKRDSTSRPLNEALYARSESEFADLLDAFRKGFEGTEGLQVVRSVYSVACGVFAANDVYDIGRKASATFFEILIGHVISRSLGVTPRRRVRIPESGAELPTDYVFDPGSNSRKVHLPIKTSTRERAVQAWVHQLVLDRIFGSGVYRGVLVVAAETKRDSKTGNVIEICVPRQLQMFQSRVAEIVRVYYLDPPQSYLDLAGSFPRVSVKSFADALAEMPGLLRE